MSLTKLTRVAVDWDGTLISDDTWPEMGDWLPYAPEALHALAAIFEEVVIWTCRTAAVELDGGTPRDPWPQIDAIAEKLNEIDAPPNVKIWTHHHKPNAQFYIDNRALRFEGDWKHTLKRVLALKQPTTANHQEDTLDYFFDRPKPEPQEFEGYKLESVEVPQGVEAYAISFDDWINGRLEKAVPLEQFQQQSPVSDPDPIFTSPTYDEIRWYDEVRAEDESVGAAMREFETGATRNVDSDQFDYEGFISPLALRAFAEYMHEHRIQADGTVRASDNWQKGIPMESYMQSLIRHVMDLWLMWRDAPQFARESNPQKILSAILFNTQGLLHETVKAGIVE